MSSNPVIDSILNDIKTNALTAARTAGVHALADVEADTQSFLTAAIPRLERWLNALLNHNLTPDEFRILLLGLKDLAFANVLTVAGDVLIEVDRVRNAVLSVVTSAASAAVGKITSL